MVNSFFTRITVAVMLTSLVAACDRAEDTQAEPGHRWHKVVGTDSPGGQKNVQMVIGAVERLPSQKDRASLVLSCNQGLTDAYVVWRQYLGVYDPDVTWLAGSDPAVTETWTLSTDNEATFAPDPVELIKQMMNRDLFLIKTTPFGGAPVTVEFNTAGLKTEVTELRETCGW